VTRTYTSPLREARARETRERVLNAVVALLGRGEALDVPAIAVEAGVAVPTVYRHFPNREVLMDAAREHISGLLGLPPYPRTAEELVRRVPERIALYVRKSTVVRAAAGSPELQASLARRRRPLLADTLGPATAHLPPEDARAAQALVSHLSDARTWIVLTDEWELDSETASRAMAWATAALVDRLHKDKENP
jgi:AcrR family transcriptional regulator